MARGCSGHEFDGEMIGGVPGDRGRRGGVVFAAPAAADQISRRGAITRSKEEIEALENLGISNRHNVARVSIGN